MFVKDLGGHSGCKILLYEDDKSYFVRKISASVEYNERLENQCIKQEKFSNNSIKTPKVLNKGYENGLFFFDMEYIQGVTLAKYIAKINVSQIEDVVSKIVDNIDYSDASSDCSTIFLNKLNDLKKKTLSFNNNSINEAIEILENYDWSKFACSYCHGDLTLENIIVKNGEMFYIDFLDSFYDSWVLDVGKLFQDVECMWSYRNDNIDMNTKIRLIIFKDIIINKLNKIDGDYVKRTYVALLLHLIRIYPYTNDSNTIDFLDKKLNLILKKVKSLC